MFQNLYVAASESGGKPGDLADASRYGTASITVKCHFEIFENHVSAKVSMTQLGREGGELN
jgi:hypothetical protein